MNKRQTDILKLLRKADGYLTLAEIAEHMKVSVKTIRNDIASIKEHLQQSEAGEIKTKPHVGIRLAVAEGEWKNLIDAEDEEEKEIIFFIIRQLLKNDNLTAQKLAERYYIGRGRLDKILEKVSLWFRENNILFERRRGHGISIHSSEFNYRMACVTFYNEYADMYEKLITPREAKNAFMSNGQYTSMCAALYGFDPEPAARALIATEEQCGIHLNYVSGINMLFAASLSVLRIRKECEMKMPQKEKCSADGESGRIFAKSFVERLENIYRISFSADEIKFISFVADTSEIQSFYSDDSRRSFEAMNIPLCRLTVKIVNLISEIAGVDLREDRFFVRQMFIQLKASISRMEYGIVVKNQLLSQIKTKYPNMMAVAWLLGNIFEKELGLEINENEVGFLALHIGGAIERQMLGLSACIVCEYGIGVSQILKEKIARAIPELHITSVFSGRELYKIRDEQCDFVISTVPLAGYRLSRDVITVSHLLDESDITALRECMKKVRREKKKDIKEIAPTSGLFNKELIFPKCNIFDKEKLLHMMCSRLESLGYVTKEFEDSVAEREQTAPTDIGKGFAIPHGLSKYVNRSVAAFASLKEPIEWTRDGEPVDAVLLIAFDLDESPEKKNEIIRFYKSVVSFMEDDNKCAELKELTDIKKIIKIFELW